MMNGRGKSDGSIVPAKPPNKAGQPVAEAVEGRGLAKGNLLESNAHRTQRRGSAQSALERVRVAARRDKTQRFTALLHHVYDVERLRTAYLGIKREAAAGVDGQTWQHYGQGLEVNLQALSQRLKRGAYRAKPVRRAYITKEDGRLRPLGVPALEDKIVQRAAVEVLNAIYEQDFLGFSYGFRPGRNPHQALDALVVGITTRKVNWVLDADIRSFFDTLKHEWLVKFVEHRVADRRIVRLIQKWLAAGVLEEGQRTQSEVGTVQGGSISPLLANLYLHYVFDLWVQRWRTRQAHGDVVVVRYADDFVVGFQHRHEAERFLAELRERFAQFGLELHPDKTRLIRFGRFAVQSGRGAGRGQTANLQLPWLHAVLREDAKGRVHGAAPDDAKAVAGQAARGESRVAPTSAHAHPGARRLCACGRPWACALLRRAHERPGHLRLPPRHQRRLVASPASPQPRQSLALATYAAPLGSLASACSHLPSLSSRASSRHHPRWEPDAVVPLVRICGGGRG